jgi:hypothetical protein
MKRPQQDNIAILSAFVTTRASIDDVAHNLPKEFHVLKKREAAQRPSEVQFAQACRSDFSLISRAEQPSIKLQGARHE